MRNEDAFSFLHHRLHLLQHAHTGRASSSLSMHIMISSSMHIYKPLLIQD
jgi:hypothetical protein